MSATKRAKRFGQGEELRRRYASLKVSHPFEKVEAAFVPADLSFLLTDTNSLKITYISDHRDLPRGARLRQWVDYGVIAGHARLAWKAGYTPTTLSEAIDLAVSMGPETSRQEWLEILIKHPRTKRFLKACAAVGIDGPWLEVGLRSGASLKLLRDLRKVGVPPRYVTANIITGCSDSRSIQEWFAAGISPWASAQFIAAGLRAGEALTWLQAGFVPDEIIEFVSANESITACKAWLPNVPCSKVFRRAGGSRFGIAGAYLGRVWLAVCALDTPSTYQSAMFSTARQARSFLDGGYLSVSGYGFGSHSYSLIDGELALRFLCYRIGVRPPRKAPGTPDSLDQQTLEREFRRCREMSPP
jgi:hypothetical protein